MTAWCDIVPSDTRKMLSNKVKARRQELKWWEAFAVAVEKRINGEETEK